MTGPVLKNKNTDYCQELLSGLGAAVYQLDLDNNGITWLNDQHIILFVCKTVVPIECHPLEIRTSLKPIIMKKLLFILAIVMLCFSSCNKEEDMQVRVNNQYPQALNIVIGPTAYGTVSSGEITDYKGVPEGSHQISGDLTGSITLEGVGKHKFTLTIDANGGIALKED